MKGLTRTLGDGICTRAPFLGCRYVQVYGFFVEELHVHVAG